MDEDRMKGKAKDVVGSAKETVGKATGDKETERSGKAEQVEGKVQKGVGEAKDSLRGKDWEANVLKFIGGTVGIIFLIGLLVVIGLLALIFWAPLPVPSGPCHHIAERLAAGGAK
jgi:uncharacterized protein YjbJ (UPF0337 family)